MERKATNGMVSNRVVGLCDGGGSDVAPADAPRGQGAFARRNPQPRPKEWEIAVSSSTLYLMVFWLLLGVCAGITIATWYWMT